MMLAAFVLVAAYVIIFSEAMDRTNAAIVGAVAMLGLGMVRGFYTQQQAIESIDGNTVFLLAAMMIMVGMIQPTGVFQYVAVKIGKAAGGNPKLLLVYLSLAVSLISMILDNVTTVLIFAPITILITRMLRLNPMPFLVAEAMLSNIGGVATLVGDPPNIMIGSAAGISFNDFLVHMAPPVAGIWLASVLTVLYLFREELATSAGHEMHLEEGRAITDPAKAVKALSALAVIVVGFFVHHHFHFSPAYASFLGLAVALIILKPEPEALFGEVNWSVLFFFSGLFVIVGGVESTGLLALVGEMLSNFTRAAETMLVPALLLMWVAAAMSAVVDNIPFTVAMLPVLAGLEAQGINATPLWWALAIGVGLGGNGTHLGATANIIVVAESEKLGDPASRITPGLWLRKGLPAMLVSLVVASIIFATFFEFFAN
jgi:Na+/H+ antiporter NhaD/arsenite permease-like protein